MALSRRKTLALACSTVVFNSLSGCFDLSQPGTIDIRIENRDDQKHELTVTFRTDNETVSSKQFTVPSNEENRTPGVVEGGRYTVSVALNSSDSASFEFTMQGCENNSLFVSISDSGQIQMSVLDEC